MWGKVSDAIQALLLLEGVSEDGMPFFSRSRIPDSELSVSQDWKRHKPLCKADATESSVLSLNASDETAETSTQRASMSEGTESDTFEGRASGHIIDVPTRHGGTMRLTSKTLGPQMMREFRRVAEARTQR